LRGIRPFFSFVPESILVGFICKTNKKIALKRTKSDERTGKREGFWVGTRVAKRIDRSRNRIAYLINYFGYQKRTCIFADDGWGSAICEDVAGFWYSPGTDTCIKIGGYLRVETTFNGGIYGGPAWWGDVGRVAPRAAKARRKPLSDAPKSKHRKLTGQAKKPCFLLAILLLCFVAAVQEPALFIFPSAGKVLLLGPLSRPVLPEGWGRRKPRNHHA
jgi:hypothetical protein